MTVTEESLPAEYDIEIESEVQPLAPPAPLPKLAPPAPLANLDAPYPVPGSPRTVVEPPAPLANLEDVPPPSAFRMDDAVAAGLAVPGPPKRTVRVIVGMALITALSVAATTFIAREVEEPPTREQTEQLVRTIQTEAVEVGDTVKETVGAAR